LVERASTRHADHFGVKCALVDWRCLLGWGSDSVSCRHSGRLYGLSTARGLSDSNRKPLGRRQGSREVGSDEKFGPSCATVQGCCFTGCRGPQDKQRVIRHPKTHHARPLLRLKWPYPQGRFLHRNFAPAIGPQASIRRSGAVSVGPGVATANAESNSSPIDQAWSMRSRAPAGVLRIVSCHRRRGCNGPRTAARRRRIQEHSGTRFAECSTCSVTDLTPASSVSSLM
jgi:hypothetical protein